MPPHALPDLADLEAAAALVYRTLVPTPQYAWPQLAAAFGANVWIKHENHTAVGAFKVRGGLVYFDGLRRRLPDVAGVISATRGNHGQSLGFAARRHGLRATVLVPHGNSREKNAAMQSLGVELIEYGNDYQAAREEAQRRATAQGLHFMPAFHRDLVRGVASYWLEFFRAVPDLDVVYVPIGQGSGITACAAARNALGCKTRIVGVVSAHAPCYALSFAARRVVEAPVATQLADGLACRLPDEEALDAIVANASEIVQVTDDEVAAAMRLIFTTTHNVAEGAGAAALAAAWQQRARLAGRKVGLTLTGGNVDADVFARVLAGSA
ncbi:MAG TPA: threonine dehydratase [Burkholderiaceae bacterium]|nr:threonine dehydratase [Burkholderiaceae bacterium]